MEKSVMLFRRSVLALFMCTLISVPAAAQSPESERSVALLFGGGMGYVSMGDVNDVIEGFTEGITTIRGFKQIHLELEARMDVLVYLTENLAIGPKFQLLLAPKFIDVIQFPGPDGDFIIIAYAFAPGVLVHLLAPVSESVELDLSGGPSLFLAGVTFDWEDFGLENVSASGTGIGLEGGLALNIFLGGKNSTAIVLGVTGRYANISADVEDSPGEIDIDFSGLGFYTAISFPL